MKHFTQKTTVLIVLIMRACTGYSQDIDLVPGINYSYDPINSNCVIEVYNVDVCNNGNDDADPFDVTMYFYDQGTQDVYFLETTRLDNGLSGNACVTAENWTINVTDQSIPAGTYRFGIFVDSNEEITETDEDNNAGLLSGDNDYTPCSGTSSVNEVEEFTNLNIYPNPTNDVVNISLDLITASSVKVDLMDITGKKIETVIDAKNENGTVNGDFNVSDLAEGIYLVKITTGEKSIIERIVVKK